MPLTPQEVASKVFGPTRLKRGYDENEVDAFLDQVETELTRLHAENARLRQELDQSRHAPSFSEVDAGEPAGPSTRAESPLDILRKPAVSPEDAAVEQRVARMLVLAQQTADAALREAEAEAEETQASARAEAERVLSEARLHAAAELEVFERSRNALQSECDQLAAFEREYRQRLRAYLELQLHELNADVSEANPVALSRGPSGHPQGELSAGSDNRGDPPAFGAVWSPDDVRRYDVDPLVTGLPEHLANGSPAPSDSVT